jgi:hypothetical protein
MIYACCDETRREAVRAHPALNGIDFLEVLDHDSPEEALRQRTLLVHLLKPVPALTAANIGIEGGERIRPVGVEWAAAASSVAPPRVTPAEHAFLAGLAAADRILVVRTREAGDHSVYALRLVDEATGRAAPAGFDPLLARVDFSFKVECPADFDCRPVPGCPEPPAVEPEINYLAKDYATFRRLMLDRLTQLMPAWRERSPADLGVTLVELLAYVADQLSYEQDAVATEAYLGTARRRISARRHARLVDYAMDDGANARAWVQLAVDADGVVLPWEPGRPTQLLTRVPGLDPRIPPAGVAPQYEDALRSRPVVFETLHPMTLFRAHNAIPFYTWGERECCLPRGAARATLRGHLPDLRERDGEPLVLVLEEVCDPRTGRPEDVDPAHRHAVRIVEVITTRADGQPLRDPLTNAAITEIRWHEDDALPFALCLSARTDAAHGGAYIEDVAMARGNIVLADHGRTISGEPLGVVPDVRLFRAPRPAAGACASPAPAPVPPRFRPRLAEGPLTQAAAYGLDAPASAHAAATWSARDVRPRVVLQSRSGAVTATWRPQRDLLASVADDTHFVAEMESDGTAWLRFGDDRHGLRPGPGTAFTATYRVGNGTAGNVGAEALAHVVTGESAIIGVRNPLAARGGVEPESIEDVRQRAPHAFRTQERAVTAEDYAAASQRRRGVQRAAATFRWTGSWHTVFVSVDRVAAQEVDGRFEADLRRHLEPFRMAGYDLEIDGPRHAALELELSVCVEPDHFRSHVRAALLETLSNRDLPGGGRGLFHPDAFTFGTRVYLSAIYAAAQAVAGVESVHVTKFHRLGAPDSRPLEDGYIELGRLEIARLDNDPNFPERGVLRLTLGGGK